MEPSSLGASAVLLLALMHTERGSLHVYKQHQFTAHRAHAYVLAGQHISQHKKHATGYNLGGR